VRANVRGGINLRRAATTPLGWMPGAKTGSGKTAPALGERDARIRHPNQRLFGRSELAIHHDGAAALCSGPIEVGLVFSEGRSPALALSAGANPVNSTESSPSTSPPICWAIQRRLAA